MWIDAHAHLYEFSSLQLEEVMRRAVTCGISAVVNTATSIATAQIVINQCKNHPRLFAAAGISPFDVGLIDSDWPKRLTLLLALPEVIAVGEIGLDDSNPIYPDLRRQIPVFEEQLSIGRERGLPVILHSRGAENQVVSFCRNMHSTKAVFHCFTGNTATLKIILDQGYYVSFSGVITFKKSGLDEAIRYVPLNRLFIETDTPYLTPHPHRGKPNEPAFVSIVGNKVAEIRSISPETLAGQLKANFLELFGISISE